MTPGSGMSLRGLSIGFRAGLSVVDRVDLDLKPGRLVCLVGESGSGKSLTALSLIRLLPEGAWWHADQLTLDGEDIIALSEQAMERLRGSRIAMIFQEPMTSLNPVMTIGRQIEEVLACHGADPRTTRDAAIAMLRRVGIPAPEKRYNDYPHRLSGGMRQRVMIAMALVARPAVLIADEPTTALDVTLQNQILALIDDLRAELGTAVLFITHNLAIVAEIADDIVVMYGGGIVERGSREAIFADPMHPYTLALFAALPRANEAGRSLAAIEGQVPSSGSIPSGCIFAPRCPFATDRCRIERPPLVEIARAHHVACWRAPIEANLP